MSWRHGKGLHGRDLSLAERLFTFTMPVSKSSYISLASYLWFALCNSDEPMSCNRLKIKFPWPILSADKLLREKNNTLPYLGIEPRIMLISYAYDIVFFKVWKSPWTSFARGMRRGISNSINYSHTVSPMALPGVVGLDPATSSDPYAWYACDIQLDT